MEINTTVMKIGDSYFVRIPAEMAEYFGLKRNQTTKEAKIKDITNSKAEIIFQIW